MPKLTLDQKIRIMELLTKTYPFNVGDPKKQYLDWVKLIELEETPLDGEQDGPPRSE